ncbi:trehalose-6-phosphate synthase [Mesorhizobium sp. 8]|uniref:alpha,alpha-trehalose-phosphate synthase (UDP-forming) n=1 Tax=Mesorhizobium sp. 8 TaxID=2584466 RepID=UPI001120C9B4|nr:trehalose-6-phosphate synthase [Mesorhizobium sp. 8]QDC02476.1 trehalose-6-phosphate synthase [Mesorhizobium sp. 8]
MTSNDPDLFLSLSAIWVLLLASLVLSLVAVILVVRTRRGRTPRNLANIAYANPDSTVETARTPLREFEKNGQSADAALVNWTPDTLRKILADELPGAQVIVVSNREPYIHNLVDGPDGDEVELVVPASGLVSALEPITRACNGTWIAYGGGSADHLTVGADDSLQVPPDRPSYTLRRVWLSEEEHEGYYLGFANEGLWPLCHIAFTRPVFRTSDWETYQAVNRKFADTVVKEARNERPIVLVQDYHFALLPRMIRERLPEAIVITFWHIPWPNSEVFSICPWREAILDGLLGSSIIGFHTQFHCNNFIESVDRFMESRIEREDAAISYGGQTSLVHAYPISIEWPPVQLETLPSVADCRRDVREKYGLADDVKLCVGVERLDYTKGILDRLRALEDLFERHPEWIGRLTLLQVAAPSRGTLPAYRQLYEECHRYADELNRRFGRNGSKPVLMVAEHHSQRQVYEVYRAADLCLVTSLHDGMNLVAKEFVAARDDERGVLLLSTFAGASKELLEALIVNPYDVTMMADALQQALTMPGQEQRSRMRRMREIVRDNNVYRWAGSMLLDAARLRKRGEMERATAHGGPPAGNGNLLTMIRRGRVAAL